MLLDPAELPGWEGLAGDRGEFVRFVEAACRSCRVGGEEVGLGEQQQVLGLTFDVSRAPDGVDRLSRRERSLAGLGRGIGPSSQPCFCWPTPVGPALGGRICTATRWPRRNCTRSRGPSRARWS